MKSLRHFEYVSKTWPSAQMSTGRYSQKSKKHIRFEKRFKNVCFEKVDQRSNVAW